MALLTVRDLALGYDGKVIAEDLSFTVEAGDFLCVVGENGSGKTTLMKTLLKLHEPMGGRIIAGEGLKMTEIGYLPQQTQIQKDFPASVFEVVLSGCQNSCGWRPFYNAREKALARKNMERMGIGEIAERSYRDLSGGQQQRVLLARALCASGRILLLDEPVAGLDPRVTGVMYELIRLLNSEGLTIIMISHDIEAALKYASHILHVGETVFFGTRDEYADSSEGREFIRSRGSAADSGRKSGGQPGSGAKGGAAC